MSSTAWLIIATLFLAAFGTYKMFARETGFKILTPPEGKKRFEWLNKLFVSSKSDDEKGTIAKWWGRLDEESSPGQQFVVMVVALLLAYAEFHITGTVWTALIFLLIAAVIKPPKSKITKGFMYFDLGVIILAAFFTGFAGMRHQSFEIVSTWASNGNEAMARYAKSLKDKTPSPSLATLQAQPAVATAMYHPQTRVVEVLATEDRFTEVKIPPGVSASFDCPHTALAKYYHDGIPEGRIHDCVEPLEIGENLHHFRIGFSSKTETPVVVRVRITS